MHDSSIILRCMGIFCGAVADCMSLCHLQDRCSTTCRKETQWVCVRDIRSFALQGWEDAFRKHKEFQPSLLNSRITPLNAVMTEFWSGFSRDKAQSRMIPIDIPVQKWADPAAVAWKEAGEGGLERLVCSWLLT